MRKPDEIAFYAAIRAKGRGVFADTVAERLGIDWDRAQDWLLEWSLAGWWLLGVTLRSGRLADDAPGELAP